MGDVRNGRYNLMTTEAAQFQVPEKQIPPMIMCWVIPFYVVSKGPERAGGLTSSKTRTTVLLLKKKTYQLNVGFIVAEL